MTTTESAMLERQARDALDRGEFQTGIRLLLDASRAELDDARAFELAIEAANLHAILQRVTPHENDQEDVA